LLTTPGNRWKISEAEAKSGNWDKATLAKKKKNKLRTTRKKIG